MKENSNHQLKSQIELWGGLECTVNRVWDEYFCQMERSGHATRMEDLERFASLGIRAIRYPVLWERTAPDGIECADWTWPDQRLHGLQKLGVTPIVGLVHHGSGPRHTSLVDPNFAEQLAQFARLVAQRYPWIDYYTPVNEPLTTARFSGLYGLWYPHGTSERTFILALLNQCRAVVLSMRAIRDVNPRAKLVQTDDLGKSYSTPEMSALSDFYNERRWLSWDLLCGKVDPEHPLWEYLMGTGIDPFEFLWFRENACPPDIIGVNYYITSERWLDHRVECYPENYVFTYQQYHHADIEAPRVLGIPAPGIGPLLNETWERYGLPIAVTEAHIDANREDQLRWLLEIWDAANEVKRNGVDMRAVTVWALLGSYDWNCLVTECKGHYEPGPFDVRSQCPRPTAVASFMRELSTGQPLSHPVLQGEGWWRRPGRFLCPPVITRTVNAFVPTGRHYGQNQAVQPILITGATGTLGRAFARICKTRNLAYRLLSREDMDISDPASVDRAVVCYQPWAIINACGYVRVDEAEKNVERCFRENSHGPSVLAIVCVRHNIRLVTFSSDLVFDGRRQSPYVETDQVCPLNAYGRSKVEAERKVLDMYPEALVVRTSAFFGPWDSYNFVAQTLKALRSGSRCVAANDITISPTYVPDLVNACLDLLIDREKGIWHLSNGQAITWADFALKACDMAGIDSSRLEARAFDDLPYIAARPRYSALYSERSILLPTLDDALSRYLCFQRKAVKEELPPMDAERGVH